MPLYSTSVCNTFEISGRLPRLSPPISAENAGVGPIDTTVSANQRVLSFFSFSCPLLFFLADPDRLEAHRLRASAWTREAGSAAARARRRRPTAAGQQQTQRTQTQGGPRWREHQGLKRRTTSLVGPRPGRPRCALPPGTRKAQAGPWESLSFKFSTAKIGHASEVPARKPVNGPGYGSFLLFLTF